VTDEREEWLDRYEREHGYVRARLRVLATEEGGRHTAFVSGYRPNWNLAQEGNSELRLAGAAVRIEDQDQVAPGEEATVRLLPLYPDAWSHVRSGMEISMHEGLPVLGRALVLDVRLGRSARD
jgi:translation elongation factor EF-Tu-like GTPase